MHLNIVHLDHKGRLILPLHIREGMGINENTRLVMSFEDGSLKIVPASTKKNVEIHVTMKTADHILSGVLEEIAKNGGDIILSNSFAEEEYDITHFNAVVEMTNITPKKLKKAIRSVKGVRTVRIIN